MGNLFYDEANKDIIKTLMVFIFKLYVVAKKKEVLCQRNVYNTSNNPLVGLAAIKKNISMSHLLMWLDFLRTLFVFFPDTCIKKRDDTLL